MLAFFFFLLPLLAFVSAHIPAHTHITLHKRQSNASATDNSLTSLFLGSTAPVQSTSSLSIGSVSLLTNGSHLLVSLPLTSGTGYAAIGRGSSMSSNEWIVVVSGTSASPNFEVRKATSHSTPQILSAANGAPTVVGAGNEGDNVLFWVVDQTKAFSTSGESYIYASSKTAPSGGRIVQHDASKFGAFVAKFKDPSTSTSTSSSAAGGGNTSDAVEVPWTRYDSIIIIHAIVAATAWILVAPGAVLLARLGRKLFGWVKMHSLLQTALTTVLTITAVVLAVVAIQTNGGGGNLSGHQVMGFVILALLLGQICLGYYIHEKFDANRTKRPPRNVTHMFLGITLLILGYTQVYTGLRLYNEKRPNYFQSYIFALFWILVFAPFVFYGISIGLVVAHRRRKDGMSWGMSLFGLGREGGSLPALQKIPSNTQEVANEKAPVPAPQDPFQGYPNEKAGYVSGRTSPADSDKGSKGSMFSFGKKGSRDNILPKSSKDLKRNASWGNANVEQFNRSNADTVVPFPISDMPQVMPNSDFGVPTYGAGAPAVPPQQQFQPRGPQMMPGYEPSRPMPLRAATLNYNPAASQGYDPMAQRDKSGGLRDLQLSQQRSRSPPNAAPRPRGPQPMPQRSLTNDPYYQQNFYQQSRPQQVQQQRYAPNGYTS